MKHRRSRVTVVTVLLWIMAGAFWYYFAPVEIGGNTAYVITRGHSMEPRFHTGDLAIVRAASTYKVGEIVAYHSSLLREVVLHRIVAIHHGRYTFKGDNNNFLDPVHPTRAAIIGKLWIHLPRVGLVLAWFRTPEGAALLAVGIGFIVISLEEEYVLGRRPRRRGAPTPEEMRNMKPADAESSLTSGLREGLIAAVMAVVVFAALAAFAFARPSRVPGTRAVPYTQHGAFTYSAHVQSGPVYPNGEVTTGDPIFLNLVNRLAVGFEFRLLTHASADVTGTSTLMLRVASGTGWSRTLPLGPSDSLADDRVRSTASIDLASVKSLLTEVQTQTGELGTGATLAVIAKVNLAGRLAGTRLQTTFKPAMTFQLGTTQLLPANAAGVVSSASTGFADTEHGDVTVASSHPNPLLLLGHSLSVMFIRIFTGVGLGLSILAAALLGVMRRRLSRLTEPEQIEAQYRHLIVPLADDAEFAGQEPVDLVNIEALVRLAERSGRLILHSQRDGGDTYLLNDGDAVYRYRVGRPAGKGSRRPGAGRVTRVSRPLLTGEPAVSASHPPTPEVPSVSEAAAAFAAAAFAAASTATASTEPDVTTSLPPSSAPASSTPASSTPASSTLAGTMSPVDAPTQPHPAPSLADAPSETPPPWRTPRFSGEPQPESGVKRPAEQPSDADVGPPPEPPVAPLPPPPPARPTGPSRSKRMAEGKPFAAPATAAAARAQARPKPAPGSPEPPAASTPPGGSGSTAASGSPAIRPAVSNPPPHRPPLTNSPLAQPPAGPAPASDQPSPADHRVSEPEPPAPSTEASKPNPGGGEAGTLGSHAARAISDAARRWRRRLT